ncbi:MAG: SpoIIE family protein phosphatase [Magnetococcus sp. YQC-5]
MTYDCNTNLLNITSSMTNRRFWDRNCTQIQAELLLDKKCSMHGVIINLSLTGALLQVSDPAVQVSVGQMGTLKLISEQGNTLEYPCEIVRVMDNLLAMTLVDKHTTFGIALTYDLLELLHGIGSACANSLDLEETLQACVTHVRTFLQAEASSIFLVDEQNGNLVCRACSGPVAITGLTLPLDKGLVGKSVKDSTPVIVMDVRKDPQFSQTIDTQTGFVTRSLISVPLRVMDKTIGAFEVINKKDNRLFEDRDQYILSAMAATVAMAIYNARQHRQFLEHERRERELALARALQESFMPAPFPHTFPVHGANLSALELSGDFYDILPLADGRIFFLLGDVSGKGANAGLFMARISSLLRFLGKIREDPAKILESVNSELIGSVRMGMFVTLVAGLFHPQEKRVVLANAGHPPPLRYWHSQNRFQELKGDGIPLGIISNLHCVNTTFILDEGEILLLYSDGAIESRLPKGDEFLGMEGFQQLVRETAHVPAHRRLGSLLSRMHHPELHLHDDITLVLVDP